MYLLNDFLQEMRLISWIDNGTLLIGAGVFSKSLQISIFTHFSIGIFFNSLKSIRDCKAPIRINWKV